MVKIGVVNRVYGVCLNYKIKYNNLFTDFLRLVKNFDRVKCE